MRAYLFAFVIWCVVSSPVSAAEYLAEVVRVSDGDTVVVRFLGKKPPVNPNSRSKPKPNIRLRFSDTPETKKQDASKPGQPFGQAAKKFTEKALPPGTKIRLVTQDGRERGTYNRPLGVVYRGFHNINLALVAEGLAHTFPYPNPKKAITCKSYRTYIPYVYAEIVARRFKKGIWAIDGLKEFPQNYRRRTSGKEPMRLTLREYSELTIDRLLGAEKNCN